MEFIGRKGELSKLNAEYSRDSSFVVIYGRRRVGKTTLIKEFLKEKTAFYFLATEELESQSMKRLAGVIARTTKNTLLQKAAFTDWLDLFRVIADYKPEEKKVLVIDEFPYLVKTNSAFPSILQNAWDEILKDSNVMLILSGSLIGMMQKYALSYDSPLYGRRTAQMRLAPLPFTDVYAVQQMPFDQAVEQYAVTGGVPKYLEFFEDGRPLEEQLKDTVLSKNGFLYEEPNFLLKSESATAVNYFSIMKAIADGNHKLGKIAGVLGQETSALTPYLATLTDGAIPFVPSHIGSYWLNDFDGDTEIDVMSVDHQNKRVFAGECKYHAKPVDAPVYFALKEKVDHAKEVHKAFPGYEIIFGVFSKSGFTKRMLDIAKENAGIFLIHEDQLV